MTKLKREVIIGFVVIIVSITVLFICRHIGLIGIPWLDFRTVYTAYTKDGFYFTEKQKVWRMFDPTTGLVWEDGTIAIYGVDFMRTKKREIIDNKTGQSIIGLALIVSKDGKRFERKPIAMVNLDRSMHGADPTIVRRPEGGYRIYFVECVSKEIFSAVSDNGYDFVFEGSLNDIYEADPEIILSKNKDKYYMFTRTEEQDGFLYVRESYDGRSFGEPLKIRSPFNVKFDVVDTGDKYIAYGRPFYGIRGGGLSDEVDFDLRYPILAESEDGLHWVWVGRTLSGPWKSNKPLIGSAVVIKEKSGGYRLFW